MDQSRRSKLYESKFSTIRASIMHGRLKNSSAGFEPASYGLVDAERDNSNRRKTIARNRDGFTH
jgi:hypothetical protein